MVRVAVITVWVALSLAACDTAEGPGPDAAAAPADVPVRLGVKQGRLEDGLGRAVLLRGVNARVEGLFDVTFDDGRVALEEIPALAAADCQRMAELGLDLLRLPLNWSGIEPERDQIDEAYLRRVDEVVQCASDAGIYVLLDLHQDAWSKHIGEDGAPLWAIEPPPSQLLEGPLTEGELLGRRLSSQVRDAFESFFMAGDPTGLQDELIDVAVLLAERYADDPWVLGLDLFNEPVTSPQLARAFQERAAERVREAAAQWLVLFEPTFARGLNGAEAVPEGGAFSVEGAIYAPHLYPLSFNATDERVKNVTIGDLREDFEAALTEARDWGTPWLIGEWGIGPEFQRYRALHLDLQDEFFVSSAMWLWKENSQGSWGLFDDTPDGWKERPDVVRTLARPRVRRAAGTVERVQADDTRLTLELSDTLEAPHELYVPPWLRVSQLRCDGDPVQATGDHGVLRVECGDGGARRLEVEMRPQSE